MSLASIAVTGLIVISGACARESAAKVDSARVDEQGMVSRTNVVDRRVLTLPETTSTASASVAAKPDNSWPLTCSPATFTVGDTLTLRMATPHGHYLWITRPDRTSYVIVYPSEEHMKAGHTLVPNNEFVRLPSDLQSFPYV